MSIDEEKVKYRVSMTPPQMRLVVSLLQGLIAGNLAERPLNNNTLAEDNMNAVPLLKTLVPQLAKIAVGSVMPAYVTASSNLAERPTISNREAKTVVTSKEATCVLTEGIDVYQQTAWNDWNACDRSIDYPHLGIALQVGVRLGMLTIPEFEEALAWGVALEEQREEATRFMAPSANPPRDEGAVNHPQESQAANTVANSKETQATNILDTI